MDASAWWTWPELADIGTTAREPGGHDVRVTVIETPTRGIRVRALLRRDGVARRHFDITPELAQYLWPLLRDAALACQDVEPKEPTC